MKTQLKPLVWLLLMGIAAISKAWAAVPPAPKGFTADAKGSPSTITLQWTAATGLTGYELHRSTDNKTFTKVADPAATASSYSDTPLQPNTTYYYKLYAVNKDGKSTAVDANAKTAAPLAKPAVPKNLSANSTSSNQIDLNWETGNGGGAHDSFDWQCSTDKTFAKVDKEGNTNQKNTPISGLQPGTLYYLRVEAKNAAGVSGWTAHIEKGTLDSPPAVPSIAGLTASTDGKSIKVDWKNNSNNTIKIEIQWSEDLSFNSKADNLAANPTTYTVGNLTPCKKYNFRIRAFNASGTASNWSDNGSVSTNILAPGAPTNLRPAEAQTQIDLTWDAGSGITDSYTCEYGTTESYGQIATVSGKSAKASNLQPNTTYYFKVTARNCNGNASATYKTTTKAPDKPAAPTNLRTTNVAYNGVDLAWDNTVPDAKPIEIERKVGNGNFGLLKSVDGGVSTYKDSDVQPRTTYTYRVKNIKGGVASDYSNERTVTTPAPPAPGNVVATQTGVNASGKPIIKITWTNNWPQATVFEVQRSENQNSGYGKTDRNDFGNQFIDEKNTECGKTYYYRVIANLGLTDSDPSGSSNAVNTVCQPVKPATPTNLRTTVVIYNRIDLAWNNSVSDATETILERKTGAGSFSPLATFPNGTRLTYQDDNINPKTTYVYRVRIKKGGVESDNSNELTVNTPAPPAPSDVVATQTGVNASGKPIIKITWKNNWPQATVFEVQRSENQSSGYGKVDRNDFGNQFIDEKNTECGKTYYYRVIANLGLTDSDPSGPSNAVNTVCQPVKPATPTNLRTTVVIYNRIDLAWNNVVSDANETILERKTETGSFSLLATFPNGTRLTYQDGNLSSRTTYVYRVRIKKGGVESDNSNELSVTTPAPPAPTEVLTSLDGFSGTDANSNARIIITWRNNWPEATSSILQRSTEPNSGFTNVNTNVGLGKWLDPDVPCGKTYYYRVISTLANVQSDPSASSVALPAPCRVVTIPVAPTNLTAVASGSDKIVLKWTDNSYNESGFEIERASSEAGPFSKIGEVNADIKTYTDGVLVSSTQYCYQVKAKNSAGSSAYSNKSCAKTDAPAVTLPSAPTSLTTSASGSDKIVLTWTDNANNESGFDIERATSEAGPFSKIGEVNADIKTYTDGVLVSSTQYCYQVKAKNSAGSSAYSNKSCAKTDALAATIPFAPSSLTAAASGSDKIVLTWTDNSSNESGFEIERASSEAGPFVKIGEVNADIKTYTDGGLAASTNYCYQVKAKNSAGTSTYSNKSCAKTDAPAVTLPSAPTSLTTSASGSDKIVLTWTDNANNESGFDIERASSEAGPFSKIGEVNADIKTYTDGVLVSSTQYCYQVKAKNSAGSSAYSNKSCAKTDALAATIPFAPSSLTAAALGSDKIVLNWADNSSNESGFDIERATSEAGPFLKIGEVNTDIKTYTDAGLAANSNYCYQVKAKNSAGSSTYSNKSCAKTDMITTPISALAAPKALRQDLSKITINQVSMVWDNVATNATGVEIWRSVGDESNWQLYEAINTNPIPAAYTDKSVRTGNKYLYKVRATRTNGDPSDWSNTINLLAPVVNSIILHTEVKIYPNPFNGYIQLDLGRFSKASIYVFNNSGIKVFEKLKNHSNSQILDLQQLPVGSYWLVVINEAEKQTFKIIKQ